MRRTFIFFGWVFLGIQFIRMDYESPEVIPENDFLKMENPPAEVAEIFTNACYPCHSNTTVYPWYSQVAPASFLIVNNVNEGREHLNFSDWHRMDGHRKNHMIDEMIYEINEHDMPKFPYALAHPEADLTDDQRDLLDEFLSDLMYAE